MGQKGLEENLGHGRIQPAPPLTSAQTNTAAISYVRPSSPLAEDPVQASAAELS